MLEAPVRVVGLHEAELNLSDLVRAAAEGQPFIIASGGEALVTVTSVVKASTAGTCRTGFLLGILGPPDFDRTGAAEIEATFSGR